MTNKKEKTSCTRCTNVIKSTKYGWDAEPGMSLAVHGGYAAFIDEMGMPHGEVTKYPMVHTLCHKCSHEVMDFLGVNRALIKNWHRQDDTKLFCTGWNFNETLLGVVQPSPPNGEQPKKGFTLFQKFRKCIRDLT